MNPAAVLREPAVKHSKPKSVRSIQRGPGRPTVLIATNDIEIRTALAGLLEFATITAIWVGSVEDVKAVLSKERIAACLCGFWLQDGTYREVVRHLRRERKEIPTIILSTPSYPEGYRDYLSALNLGALDFLCYPYQIADLERALKSAIPGRNVSIPHQVFENGGDIHDRGAA